MISQLEDACLDNMLANKRTDLLPLLTSASEHFTNDIGLYDLVQHSMYFYSIERIIK